MKKISLLLIVLVFVLSVVVTGCSSGGGIPQADYDALKAQLSTAQSALTQANAEKSAAQDDLQKAQANATTLQAQVSDLESQIAALKAEYENKGGTLAEIAARIVKTYNETHVYSTTDMFICGDMSSEVWNMLKAAGISSVIVIGNKDTAVTDILASDHAWVLADIGNGEKLALETTAGTAITRTQNPLYYRGWTFSSPNDLKNNNDWIKEYNTRVVFRNLLASEVNAAMTLYNNSSNEAEADKYLTLYNKLKELKDDQEALLIQLKAKIDGLAATL